MQQNEGDEREDQCGRRGPHIKSTGGLYGNLGPPQRAEIPWEDLNQDLVGLSFSEGVVHCFVSKKKKEDASTS